MTASLVIRLAAGIMTAGENAAPLQSSGGKAAKTPGQPFAEIAARVNARADKRADHVVAGKMPENPLARGDRPPVPLPGISTRMVVAKPPAVETRKTTPCAGGTSGMTRAVPSTTETRKTTPRDPIDEAPALETLIQAGCEAAVGPAPVQPVKGPSPKVAMVNPAALGGKQEIPDRPWKKWRSPDGTPTGDSAKAGVSGRVCVLQRAAKRHESTVAVLAGGQSPRTPATVQAGAGPGIRQQTVLSVDPEKPVLSNGASVLTGKPASPVPQMSDKQCPARDAIPPEAVTPSRRDGSGAEAPVPAKQGAVETKHADGRVSGLPTVESKVLQARAPVKDPQFQTEQTRQANPPTIQAQNGQPLVEPHHVSAPGPGDVGSEGRQAASDLDGPRRTRQAAETSVSPIGAKTANPSQADGNAASHPPMMVAENGRSMAAPEPLSPAAPVTAGAFEGAAARSPTASVGEQILDSVHASLARGEQQLVVRLRPPELGSVLVRFGQGDGGIHGVLEVGRSDTRRQIEQALPQMLRSLQELGIQVRRLDVTVADQPENDLGKGQSQQGTWTQQQGSDQHTNQPQRSFDTGWAAGPGDGDVIELHEVAQAPTDMPADRIDMLA